MSVPEPQPLDRDGLFAGFDAYYAPRLAEHGASAPGVDWSSRESQALRFRQLLRVREDGEPCSLLDFGCGYGALAHLLVVQDDRVDYRGFDVSRRMIDLARAHNPDRARCRFSDSPAELEPADYVVASGVFNLRLDVGDVAWEAYVLETLDTLAAHGRRGFAFNLLTSWSDADRKRPDLYYADPARFFDHCKRRYSRHVALLHDYGLYEWTMLVRTDA
jgi:SAM-dependent methyltransferase